MSAFTLTCDFVQKKHSMKKAISLAHKRNINQGRLLLLRGPRYCVRLLTVNVTRMCQNTTVIPPTSRTHRYVFNLDF